MRSFSPVSRGILIALIWCLPVAVAAQDSFGVDDMSAYEGYRGYTTYHTKNRTDNRVGTSMMGQNYPEPITNMRLMAVNDGEGYARANKKLDEETIEGTKLEEFYRKRTSVPDLNQYGYDLFYTPESKIKRRDGNDENDYFTMPAGAVQDNYVLQAGDKVRVTYMGERREEKNYTIASDGRLNIDGLNPINVMGRSLAQVKNDLVIAKQDMNYRGDIDLTVSAIRQIGVLVAGQVEKPGRHNLNAFHSVLDVLNLAGGVRKSGSLRNIKLIRNGNSQIIDLYNFIVFQSAGNDLMLQDGDRIIVPPIGATFAVTGDVKQSGIFELKSHFNRSELLNLSQAVSMAGGLMGAGDVEYSVMRGDGQVVNILNNQNIISDGSILTVTRAIDRLANGVEVKGYSRKNGIYDLNRAGTLHELMGDKRIFGDDTYPLIGVISRVNRDSLTRKLMGFSPQAVASASDDRQLEAGDVVYLFSNDDVLKIISKNNDKNKYPNAISGYVLDNVVTIQGAVRGEGKWPVGTQTDLQTIISVAGGLTSKASRTNIEITSQNTGDAEGHRRRKIDAKDLRFADVMLSAGDQVRVNERYDQAVEKTVHITGEVKYPGAYDLMRGDKLSSIIERAGGLTPDAYPPAAVFSRAAERKREEQKFRNAAQELERTVSVNLNAVDRDASLTPAQITMARKLADDLRDVQAVGRVTVEADPIVLGARPELDMLLEGGDRLHVPKRSLSVRVSGEVMHPTSLLFENSKSTDDYIREAGGKTYYADGGRAFVVYPDGSAQPLDGGWVSNERAMIIPGSTIIVPRDPKPFNFMDSFKDITQILTNMAITGVFVEDIANDEN